MHIIHLVSYYSILLTLAVNEARNPRGGTFNSSTAYITSPYLFHLYRSPLPLVFRFTALSVVILLHCHCSSVAVHQSQFPLCLLRLSA